MFLRFQISRLSTPGGGGELMKIITDALASK
jgi:hypothetical protein